MIPAVALPATSLPAVDELLGGRQVLPSIPRSALDRVAVIGGGISADAVE